MYLTLSSPFGVKNNVHEYLTKTTGLFAYWHTNGYTIICCLLMVTWCPSLTTLKMSTATKNLLFRSLRNNFSNVQTYSKHLKVCQWLNTVGYPDWWAPPGIQTAYTCQLDMTCMRFLPCHDRNLRKHPGDFRRLSEDFKTLPKMSADVLKTFERFRNFFTRQQS